MSALDEYRASLDGMRNHFLAQQPMVVEAFRILGSGFDALSEALQHGRDSDDKTHVSLAPLLFILQRQVFVALDALSSQQAYQAWVLLRPGIECPLIMGKWMDDVRNYHIWVERRSNPKAYRDTYSGRGIISTSLPRAADIQAALKAINDSFLHPNPDYYSRHTRLRELDGGSIELKVEFFDDESFHWSSVLAILHLLIVVQESIGSMFDSRFANVHLPIENFGRSGFVQNHESAAAKAADAGPEDAYVIHDLGLWPRVTAA